MAHEAIPPSPEVTKTDLLETKKQHDLLQAKPQTQNYMSLASPSPSKTGDKDKDKQKGGVVVVSVDDTKAIAKSLSGVKAKATDDIHSTDMSLTLETSVSSVNSDYVTMANPKTTVRKAANWSLATNTVLFCIKLVVFVFTLSLAVLASLVDSTLDLVSQAIMWKTERNVGRRSDRYPVGRTRLEPVGILSVSILMCASAFTVIRESLGVLFTQNFNVSFEWYTILPMIAVIVAKLLLFAYCRQFASYSPIAKALAEDHFNDVLSNTVALAAGVTAAKARGVKWLDAVGGILISFYIIYSWLRIGREELRKLVGHRANEDTTGEIRDVCESHHSDMSVDIVRAYHIGRNLLVEVEVIMPQLTTLRVVHDVSLQLQKKIEAFEYVERAFVHVDYLQRDYDEHKTPVLL